MINISEQQQAFKSSFNGRNWLKTENNPSGGFEDLQIFLEKIPSQELRERLLNSAIDDAGNTPLHIVAMEGNTNLAKLFVEYGANIDALNGDGYTAEQIATKNSIGLVGKFFNAIGASKYPNTIEVSKYLTSEKLKKDQQITADSSSDPGFDGDELTPEQIGQEVQKALVGLKKSNNEQDYLEHLLIIDNYLNEHGASEQDKREIFNFPIDNAGNTALHHAAELGYLVAIKFLHDNKKVDVNVKNKYGDTPLHGSSMKGHDDVSKYLLRGGADIDSANGMGVTPLHYALAEGTVESAQFLLEAGANAIKTDNSGNTSLHYAAIGESTDIIENILNKKVYIDEKNKLGNTALFTAVINENVSAVKCLIVNGADINIKNQSEKTPLDYAKTDEIKTLILSER